MEHKLQKTIVAGYFLLIGFIVLLNLHSGVATLWGWKASNLEIKQ